LLVANAGLQLLNPQLVKIFIDTATIHGFTSTLLLLALALIVSILVSQGIAISDTYVGEYIAWSATNQLRADLLAHCLSLDLSFHKLHPVGELIERIDGDVDTLSNFFSRLVIELIGNSLLLLGGLAIFFQLDWRLGCLLLAYILFYLTSMTAVRKRLMPIWSEQRQASADFYGFLSEWLRGIADLRANGATGAFMRRFSQRLQDWFPITRKAALVGQQMSIVGFSLISGTMLSMFLVSTYLHHLEPQRITIGTVFALHNYLLLLLGPIWSIQAQLQELQQAEACIQRIDALFLIRSLLPDTGVARLPTQAHSVELKNVSFAYTSGNTVIHDLSFSLKPGKVLGVLGRTGSGKTTLTRLLFRLYDVQQGEIVISGIPISHLPLAHLRQHIGLVTQDVQLFHASLRDNLTFFDRSLPDLKILDALEQVGLLPWFQTLPGGLDTLLGNDGSGLSAGEAQLVAFARIFLRNPGLVILDEASSRLDPLSESLIERALDRLLFQRTVIIIAHRLSTIRRTDDILILEHGLIQEYGSRIALAADPRSRFSCLQQAGQEVIAL
jgi:ATP-binding cassette subfamily B protein